MREKTKKNLSGFTLIELMISVAIISIMAGVTIVSLGGSKTKQEVEGATRQVVAVIREAQNNAVTGKNISGVSTDRPCQFRVNAAGSSSDITVQQIKSVSGVCDTDSGSALTYSLLNGVTIAAAQVRFDVPRGEPKDSAGAELIAGNIDFSVSKSGSTAHVCVYPLGRIMEKRIGESC